MYYLGTYKPTLKSKEMETPQPVAVTPDLNSKPKLNPDAFLLEWALEKLYQ